MNQIDPRIGNNEADIWDKANVYFFKGLCGCCEATAHAIERLNKIAESFSDRIFSPPENVLKFRASIARGGDLDQKCKEFVERLCRENKYNPGAQVTHQMDSEMVGAPEERVRHFIQRYFSQYPQMMDAFTDFQNSHIRKIN